MTNPIASAPIAAISLKFEAQSLYPTSEERIVFLIKWIPSTIVSVEIT